MIFNQSGYTKTYVFKMYEKSQDDNYCMGQFILKMFCPLLFANNFYLFPRENLFLISSSYSSYMPFISVRFNSPSADSRSCLKFRCCFLN